MDKTLWDQTFGAKTRDHDSSSNYKLKFTAAGMVRSHQLLLLVSTAKSHTNSQSHAPKRSNTCNLHATANSNLLITVFNVNL